MRSGQPIKPRPSGPSSPIKSVISEPKPKWRILDSEGFEEVN